MKDSFITSLVFTVTFLLMQVHYTIAMEPLQIKKVKKKARGGF